MQPYEELLQCIQGLQITDAHEHQPLEKELPPQTDALNQWLMHYVWCGLVSAGMADADLRKACDPRGDGRMDLERAEEIAGWVFVPNPTRLFGLEQIWER